MKYTLLEMVQDVLSSSDGDEVNSITDTIEADQVARIIRACYFDIYSTSMPEATTLYQLEASGNSAKPVMMTRPSDVHSLITLKYNKATEDDTDPQFVTLTPLSIEEFFDRTHMLNLSEDYVSSMTHTIDGDDFTFLYRTDKAPDWYTCIDDHTFFFDSIDTEVDTTLQKSKTWCLGEKETTFLLEDDYEIDLDERQHVWLLNEAKALAYQELKQQTHAYAERAAKRQRIRAQKTKYVNNDVGVYYNSLPIFGRRTPVNTNAVKMH
jgi:hypothetical protein